MITLGIIGIVAALTMPVLIQNHKKQETSAKLKKFYSIMFQAIRMSENDNGPATAWEYIATRDENGDEILPEANRNGTLAFFNKYLAKYIKYQSIDKDSNRLDSDQEEGDTSRYIRVYFADGSLVYMKTGACLDIKLDVNGEKGKNELGKDIFTFVLCPESSANHQCPHNNYFCGYGGYINKKLDRNNILTSCRNDKGVCTRLLMFDSWEFKSDYPYKL